MKTIEDKKQKIQSIVNVFETGSIKGDYSNVSLYNDGPNRIKQVTYGKSQTTEYGNLADLVKMYIDNKGKYAEELKPFVTQIGKTPLANNQTFIQLLKSAGSDPVMQTTQDAFFDKHYWQPALKFCTTNGFTSPLAGLVIYDSFIHSGSILSFLRNKFAEKVPVTGGNEQAWVAQYLTARLNWLSNHSNPILRKTTYRVKNMLQAVNNKDWELEKPFNANGVLVP